MAVPAGAIAERRLIERLLRADAVRAESAQPLENLSFVESRRLPRLVAHGVIREAGQGRYYVYAPALADRMANRRVRVLILLLAVVMLGILTTIMAARFR